MANKVLFPYIRCEGTPYEIGVAHGTQGREKIRTSIECYRSMFFDYSGIDWDTAQRYAHTFIPAIESYDPDIMAEIRGIADGSGFGLDEILALNVRSEIVLQGSQDVGADVHFLAPGAASRSAALTRLYTYYPAYRTK